MDERQNDDVNNPLHPGYVQSPYWGLGRNPVLTVDQWLQVDIPAQHTAVVSRQYSVHVLSLLCQDHNHLHTLSVSVGSASTRRVVWRNCQGEKVFTVTSSSFWVYFKAKMIFFPRRGNYGFRLLCSFHSQSDLPSQLPDGRWNCSVPDWSHFEQHFPCNLQADCVDGEDELSCPYTHLARCGAGAITLGDSCYYYVISSHRLSWNDAMEACKLKDAYLANLNTPQEWDDVMQLLLVREGGVFVGLRSSDLKVPFK